MPVALFALPLELALDASEMAMHRIARAFRVARRHAFQDRRVVAQRLLGEPACMEMLLRAAPHLRTLIPQLLDPPDQGAVAGGAGEPHVERAIGLLAHGEVVEMGLHPGDAFAERGYMRRGGLLRRERGDL